MKTVLITLVSGIFICLITSIGMDTGLEMYDNPSEHLNQYGDYENNISYPNQDDDLLNENQ
ncbi:MAG: hypothetical protein V7719_03210 [Psychroserpens sp.]|uniref:hypothetical protein n=1 Tax=Psychroserpens sp. TaxID=2020870 RepID=UPI00300224BD